MNKGRLIILTDRRNRREDFDQIGVPTLVKEGWFIEVWNLSNILYRNRVTLGDDSLNAHGCTYRILNSKIEFAKSLFKLSKDYFIINYFFYSRAYWLVYFLLTLANRKYCGIVLNAVPELSLAASKDRSFWNRVLKKMRSRTLSCSIRVALNYSLEKLLDLGLVLGLVKCAEFVCFAGEKCLEHYKFPSDAQTKVIWMHSYDYEKVLVEQQVDVLAEKNYGVFLDEYMPFHPDWGLLGIAPPATAEKYYSAHRCFFDYLEKATGAKVIVAMHPKAAHTNYSDFFGGRTCISGSTRELVQGARFVVSTFSTSVGFAVIYRKPILFVHTGEMKDSVWGADLDRFASWFNKRSIEIDNITNLHLNDEFKIDADCYNRYVRLFLKSPQCEFGQQSMWPYFAAKLRESIIVNSSRVPPGSY